MKPKRNGSRKPIDYDLVEAAGIEATAPYFYNSTHPVHNLYKATTKHCVTPSHRHARKQ
ncbi:MAG: hypothetical protein ACI8PG_000544 [Planctomycetota bacterium]|jgi:hypothetical protein